MRPRMLGQVTRSGMLKTMPDEVTKRDRAAMFNEPEHPADDVGMLESVGPSPEEEEQTAERIKMFAASLVKKRNVAIEARATCGIEQIWKEDELGFEGRDLASMRTSMIDYAMQTAPVDRSSKSPNRSQVVINIIRPKCETAEGRFSDIQLPTDDRNWGLKITPKPEMSAAMKDERPAMHKETQQPVLGDGGQPVPIKEIARSDKERAEESMSKMQVTIDDQLTECSFNGECRKAIQNAVRLGTGILKGPMVVKDIKKVWRKVEDGETTVRVLEATEDTRPASRSIDPQDVWPDPECRDDIKRAAFIWERRAITPRELRDVATVKGYFKEEIAKVLQEEPSRLTVAMPKENEYLVRYITGTRGSSYELWEYNGDVDKSDLEAMGCDCSGTNALFPSMTACVIMVNDHVIKVTLSTLDTGALPYDFFVWTKRSGVPWGIGVARELMWPQRVLIAAWRAMMDNAGDSSGANVVVGASVEPMDGKWEITGKKLWKSTDETLRIDKQFGQFQIENNQSELQAVIELALKFADMESQLPMLFSGEKGELPETLGATNIMVDSANVALRSRVKLWDDNITRPHIGRYYDWNMQYNEDDEIKGDYKVDPRGTSILLERDQEWQTMKDVLTVRQDKELSSMIDWKKAIKKFFAARKADILLPDDKIAENEEAMKKQPPPQDPVLQVAQLRAEGELKKVQVVQQTDIEEMNWKASQAALDRQQEMQLKLLDRDIKAMELSATSGIALDKIKAELTQTAQKLNVQVSMSKDKNAKPSPQLTEPVVEPPQRAKPGYAFQQ